ncbi:MAG: Lrp/AsnC family transcriptional regulator [Proteobacteria bacterium]|nr:Lrp/AsnC family transcriptional regulator [Pseudomonadota bacterium]
MPDINGNAKATKKKQIDLIDSRIIRMLQVDGRLSNTEIGKHLDLSEATVRSRIKRLIDEDFVQIVAVSNPFKLGFEIAGDLYIHVEMKKIDAVLEALKEFKELWYIILTTGNTHINAEFVAKSLEELHDLVYNQISKIDGVIKIEISVIMKYVKRKYDYGTALDEEPFYAVKNHLKEI